ncbi:MAG: hypothetical protein RL425_1590, partial [Pseudomonadota bacterium]
MAQSIGANRGDWLRDSGLTGLFIPRQRERMCNLYRLDAPAHQIADIFDAQAGGDPWVGGYVAPGRPAPVIVRQDGARVMVPRMWGVPPPPKGDHPITNIRNLSSPFW